MKNFITVKGTRVQLTHFMPFDPIDGLEKTEEELMQIGYLVDEIPEPEQIPGKTAEAHYAPDRGFWYEYIDIPTPSTTPNMTLSESVAAGIITSEQYEQITGVKYVS